MLIEAASAIIREKGYAHLSMEAVAARAGVSRGSIYGNFRDRNDLIAAVGAERAPRVFPAPTPGADLRTQLRAVGKTIAEAARRHRDDTIYWSAYMTYVQSDEELKRRAAEQGRMVRKMIVDAWSAALPPEAMPMPVETFVKVLTDADHRPHHGALDEPGRFRRGRHRRRVRSAGGPGGDDGGKRLVPRPAAKLRDSVALTG